MPGPASDPLVPHHLWPHHHHLPRGQNTDHQGEISILIVRENIKYKNNLPSQCCRGKKCDFSYLVIYDLVMFLITTVTLSVGTHFITDLSDRINYATHRPNADVSQSLTSLSLYSFNNSSTLCQCYVQSGFWQPSCFFQLLCFEY